MRILVTAGNTHAMIDRVRCVTNIFSGQTGARIAVEAYKRGDRVYLLTSHPDAVEAPPDRPFFAPFWWLAPYRTFEELEDQLRFAFRTEDYDAVIHCAAVSDYLSAGVYAPAAGTRFEPRSRTWHGGGSPPTLEDRGAGKVKSDEPELWLRLTRAPKLIDRVRTDWKFKGILVKFKLEVGISERELHEVAERSRAQSQADLMVANTLDGMHDWALLGPLGGDYVRIARKELPNQLLDAVENLHEARSHG